MSEFAVDVRLHLAYTDDGGAADGDERVAHYAEFQTLDGVPMCHGYGMSMEAAVAMALDRSDFPFRVLA